MHTKILPFEDRPAYEFQRWLEEAKSLDKYCYHRGDHLEGLAGRVAWASYTMGKTILFQKREASGFSYWAQKR